MSVAVLIYRSPQISAQEWRAFVSSDGLLRLRTEPYTARNPKSGKVIAIPMGEGDSEIQIAGQWLLFLRWRSGSLTTEYEPELELPSNPLRLKLAQVAKQLQATLGTDAGDEALEW
jgi:hypothetical protein